MKFSLISLLALGASAKIIPDWKPYPNPFPGPFKPFPKPEPYPGPYLLKGKGMEDGKGQVYGDIIDSFKDIHGNFKDSFVFGSGQTYGDIIDSFKDIHGNFDGSFVFGKGYYPIYDPVIYVGPYKAKKAVDIKNLKDLNPEEE